VRRRPSRKRPATHRFALQSDPQGSFAWAPERRVRPARRLKDVPRGCDRQDMGHTVKILGNCIIIPPRVSPLLPSLAPSSKALWPGVTRLTFMNAAHVDHRSAARNILSRARPLVSQKSSSATPIQGTIEPRSKHVRALSTQQCPDGCNLNAGKVVAAKFVESNGDTPTQRIF